LGTVTLRTDLGSAPIVAGTITAGTVVITSSLDVNLSGTITSPNVTISSVGGSIFDGNGAAMNLAGGGTAVLSAAGGIGTVGDPLELGKAKLEAAAGTGVYIRTPGR